MQLSVENGFLSGGVMGCTILAASVAGVNTRNAKIVGPASRSPPQLFPAMPHLECKSPVNSSLGIFFPMFSDLTSFFICLRLFLFCFGFFLF